MLNFGGVFSPSILRYPYFWFNTQMTTHLEVFLDLEKSCSQQTVRQARNAGIPPPRQGRNRVGFGGEKIGETLAPSIVWYIFIYGGFPKMVGFPNNHAVFLLKMIILGCFGGTPIFGNTQIYTYIKENNTLRDSVFYISLRRNFKECQRCYYKIC